MFYNSLLSYTINFEVLQLSNFLFHKLRCFTTLSFLKQSTSKFYNSLLSYKITVTFYISLLSCTITFDVSQLSTILYNQLRCFTSLSCINQLRCYTTLYYLTQSTSKCYNSLLSYKTTLTFYISLLSCTIFFGGLQLSILWYKQLRRFTTLSYINQLRCYTTLYYLKQSTSTFSNSPLSYILNFDILQLSTLSYNHLRRFTTIYYFYNPLRCTLLPYTINFEVFNSLDTINFEVLQLSSILYNQLRRFTNLQFLIQSTLKFYNSLLSDTINFEVLHLSSFLSH